MKQKLILFVGASLLMTGAFGQQKKALTQKKPVLEASLVAQLGTMKLYHAKPPVISPVVKGDTIKFVYYSIQTDAAMQITGIDRNKDNTISLDEVKATHMQYRDLRAQYLVNEQGPDSVTVRRKENLLYPVRTILEEAANLPPQQKTLPVYLFVNKDTIPGTVMPATLQTYQAYFLHKKL